MVFNDRNQSDLDLISREHFSATRGRSVGEKLNGVTLRTMDETPDERRGV
jgi:hypothetical protein